jgi:3-oxoacyl-[acyl-carrier protein] reductase
MIRAALPSMRERGGGSILTVTSMSVKEPIDVLILSNVMRSGVTSLVKSLSAQLAADNIRLNNLMPGRINTCAGWRSVAVSLWWEFKSDYQ